ncbi:hypothetical protein [Catellatospora paridis]|uniref:hypothetical protein n=1 Tax=Catellatospora paridis TaxID=1617086 RepID=UPI0012D43CB8|nr:hypothetical protein [Catellatospora paridis]
MFGISAFGGPAHAVGRLRSPSARARLLLLLLAAAALSGLLWVVRWESVDRHAYPDTYWYARQAAMIGGTPEADAERFAAELVCRQRMPSPTRGQDCLPGTRQWASGLPPRYQRIFTTRPGYSLVAAPFVQAFGERGLIAATALLAVLAGVLAALAVRLLGGGPISSLFATLLLFLLPTGFWLSRLLGEAGATAFALAALCAAIPLLRPGSTAATRRLTAIGMLIALLATATTKPATGLLLSLALTVTGAGLVLWHRRRDGWDAGLLLFTAAAGTATAVWLALSAALHIPGASETLQDKFTMHFTQPDVPDPWTRLAQLNREFWPARLNEWWSGGAPSAASTVLAALVIGYAALFRALPARMALVWAAAGATGLLILIAHPIAPEVDRLVLIIWLPVAVGVAMLMSGRRPETALDPTPEAPAGPPESA